MEVGPIYADTQLESDQVKLNYDDEQARVRRRFIGNVLATCGLNDPTQVTIDEATERYFDVFESGLHIALEKCREGTKAAETTAGSIALLGMIRQGASRQEIVDSGLIKRKSAYDPHLDRLINTIISQTKERLEVVHLGEQESTLQRARQALAKALKEVDADGTAVAALSARFGIDDDAKPLSYNAIARHIKLSYGRTTKIVKSLISRLPVETVELLSEVHGVGKDGSIPVKLNPAFRRHLQASYGGKPRKRPKHIAPRDLKELESTENLLSVNEEHMLAEIIRANPQPDSPERQRAVAILTRHNIGMVRQLASIRTQGKPELFDELVSEGLATIARRIPDFDPKAGTFTTFITVSLVDAMNRYIMTHPGGEPITVNTARNLQIVRQALEMLGPGTHSQEAIRAQILANHPNLTNASWVNNGARVNYSLTDYLDQNFGKAPVSFSRPASGDSKLTIGSMVNESDSGRITDGQFGTIKPIPGVRTLLTQREHYILESVANSTQSKQESFRNISERIGGGATAAMIRASYRKALGKIVAIHGER